MRVSDFWKDILIVIAILLVVSVIQDETERCAAPAESFGLCQK